MIFNYKVLNIMKRITLLIIGIISLTSLVFSQANQTGGTLKGRVTDVDKNPMVGVNVVVKGTTFGTVTDIDGYFELGGLKKEKVEILVSFIGYLTETESIDFTKSDLITQNFMLIDDIESIDEVVIVGYGRIKKSDLTGAVSSVKSEQMKDMPISGLDQALQGRAAGVMVTNNTGAPGSGVSIQVRGIGSIARSNEPLYIIDGIPLDNTQISNPQTGSTGDKINPMANINPDDIESIEILKDPASCAIYGARGANGVVLITTKRGTNGGNVFEFNTYYGTSMTTNKLDLLNSKDYQQLIYEGERKRRTPLASKNYVSDEEVEKYNTDWQDAIFRAAPTYNVNLSARGGSEKTKYMISGGYYNTKGIIINTGFERYSLRTNLDMKMTDRIKIGGSFAVSHSKGKRQRNGVSNASIGNNKSTGGPILMSALASSPVYPVYDSLGNYGFDYRNRAIANPVMLANEQNISYFTNRALTNAYIDIEIIDGLVFNGTFGADVRGTKENFFWGPYLYPDSGEPMPGSARTSDNNYFGLSWVLTTTLNYNKAFGDHNVAALLGHEASRIENQNTYTEVGGMPIGGVSTMASSPAKLQSSNYYGASTLESYFGRVNYSYKGKYLAQFNIRGDGSSRFGPEQRWGFFPAASVGWNIAKESFMLGQGLISELKLRVSVGKTGNQEVGDYNWRGSYQVGTILDPWDVDNMVMNYLSQLGGKATSISVYNYSWEEHTTYNFGLDYAMLKNRIYLSTDYYKRISDGLLLQVSLPITTGVGGAWNNAGKVTNEGFEFAITSRNMVGDFKWTTDFNISTNKFTVNELITDSIKGYNTIIIEGQTLSFFTYEREQYVDSLTGHVVLIDQNGDGQISYGGGNEDKKTMGSPLPKFFGGITNTFSYRGFDFSFFLQFVYGNNIYNATRQTLEDLQVASGLTTALNSTQESFDNRYIKVDIEDDEGNVIYPENRQTIYPTTNFAGNNTDQREGHNGWIEDGSYMRLKTLSFGYTLPKKWLKPMKVSSARVYFSSNNLLTWTNYSGFDPEVNTITGNSIGANLSPGIDAGAYPQAKTFTFGISMKF